MRISAFSSTVFAASIALSTPAFSANTLFTSEGTFQAAAGVTQIESFETIAPRLRAAAPIVTPLLTVTPLAAPDVTLIGIQNGPDAPETGHGTFAFSGSQYLFSYNLNQPTSTLRFTFNAPVNAFALTLTDAGEGPGGISLKTDAGFFASGVALPLAGSGNGSTLFYGVTQDVSFTEAVLTVSITDEAFGVDRVHIAVVPEPAEYALMLAGLALVGAATRRRRRI